MSIYTIREAMKSAIASVLFLALMFWAFATCDRAMEPTVSRGKKYLVHTPSWSGVVYEKKYSNQLKSPTPGFITEAGGAIYLPTDAVLIELKP